MSVAVAVQNVSNRSSNCGWLLTMSPLQSVLMLCAEILSLSHRAAPSGTLNALAKGTLFACRTLETKPE